MNKAGYVLSLIGGLLAVILAVLMIATGPVLVAREDAQDFLDDYEGEFWTMWTTFGEYNHIEPFAQADLDDYIRDYQKALRRTDSRDLDDIGKEYDMDSFDDLSNIVRDFEEYLPVLRIGVIGSLIAAVLALVGAQIALRYRIAGGVLVLVGAVGTLVFSLIASSILPMAAASLLLVLGGIFQMVKKRPPGVQPISGTREEAVQ